MFNKKISFEVPNMFQSIRTLHLRIIILGGYLESVALKGTDGGMHLTDHEER